MPDLGRYALEVGLAYAGSLALLGGLVGWVWWRGRMVKAHLAEVESRRAETER
jgi:heme exporter protein D